MLTNSVYDYVLQTLLKPNVTMEDMKSIHDRDTMFLVSWSDLSELCKKTLQLVQNDPMVLELRAPVKGTYYSRK